MGILKLFINFIGQILSIKILGFELIYHIISVAIISIIFTIIYLIGNVK